MADTYSLVTISDLLKVPIDRREDCVRDLLYALALTDLAFGVESEGIEAKQWTWTDDGDHSASINVNGEEMLTLKITEGGT
jgi:hypothetical protein